MREATTARKVTDVDRAGALLRLLSARRLRITPGQARAIRRRLEAEAARPLSRHDPNELNIVAHAVAEAAGEDGWLPLNVRYGAAAAALDVVDEWRKA